MITANVAIEHVSEHAHQRLGRLIQSHRLLDDEVAEATAPRRLHRRAGRITSTRPCVLNAVGDTPLHAIVTVIAHLRFA